MEARLAELNRSELVIAAIVQVINYDRPWPDELRGTVPTAWEREEGRQRAEALRLAGGYHVPFAARPLYADEAARERERQKIYAMLRKAGVNVIPLGPREKAALEGTLEESRRAEERIQDIVRRAQRIEAMTPEEGAASRTTRTESEARIDAILAWMLYGGPKPEWAIEWEAEEAMTRLVSIMIGRTLAQPQLAGAAIDRAVTEAKAEAWYQFKKLMIVSGVALLAGAGVGATLGYLGASAITVQVGGMTLRVNAEMFAFFAADQAVRDGLEDWLREVEGRKPGKPKTTKELMELELHRKWDQAWWLAFSLRGIGGWLFLGDLLWQMVPTPFLDWKTMKQAYEELREDARIIEAGKTLENVAQDEIDSYDTTDPAELAGLAYREARIPQ